MKKIYGFSLAEALITLLIICIIAIATVPVITKKKRDPNRAASVLWKVENTNPKVLIPSSGRDIKLGQIDNQNSQGIIISRRLEFKNREGKTIAYIDENGENSFHNNNEILERQEQIISILNNLNSELSRALEIQENANYNRYNNSDISYDQRSRIKQMQNEVNALMQISQ